MPKTSQTAKTHANYCSRCEEVVISRFDNLCKGCCDAIDAEYAASIGVKVADLPPLASEVPF